MDAAPRDSFVPSKRAAGWQTIGSVAECHDRNLHVSTKVLIIPAKCNQVGLVGIVKLDEHMALLLAITQAIGSNVDNFPGVLRTNEAKRGRLEESRFAD